MKMSWKWVRRVTVGPLISCKMALTHGKYSARLRKLKIPIFSNLGHRSRPCCSSYCCRSSFSSCQRGCGCAESASILISALASDWLHFLLYKVVLNSKQPAMWFTWLRSRWPITLRGPKATAVVPLLCHWAFCATASRSSHSSVTCTFCLHSPLKSWNYE